MPNTPTDPHGCTLCSDPERRRLPDRPPVCEACRSWLAKLIGDLRILAEQLATPEPAVRDDRVSLTLRWRDPVAHLFPSAPVPGQPTGPHVASVPGSRPPTALDPIDLALPARQGSRGPAARGVLGLDYEQGGNLSLATALDTWVRDWAVLRGKGEGLPAPTVDALTRWLANRVEWACDEHPGIDEFAAEIREYCGTLRRVLGVSERAEYHDGVACAGCGQRALYRRPGGDWIECGGCPRLISPAEFAERVGEQAQEVTPPRRRAA
jgi:ribosomal protein L37AE/L43A